VKGLLSPNLCLSTESHFCGNGVIYGAFRVLPKKSSLRPVLLLKDAGELQSEPTRSFFYGTLASSHQGLEGKFHLGGTGMTATAPTWPRMSSATTANFIKVPEEVGRIFVNPSGTGALKFLLSVTAGQQSDAQRPRPTRRKHIPDRIADHDGVFDICTETVSGRQKKVRIRFGILDLVASHNRDLGRIDAKRVQI
jgi:hypothetical protein